ncbi:MAG: AMP nucleosidase [Burkholderiaceae bacterium]|nr:AMP nucleosidase [Burkholderiaceae bacterium]
MLTPNFIAPAHFDDPAAALVQVRAIYQDGVGFLRERFQRFLNGERFSTRVRACYPYVRLQVDSVTLPDAPGISYGFVAGPGVYETTLTRPDIFANYYREQFRLLLVNHGPQALLEIGVSQQPIPIHFSFEDNEHIEGSLSIDQRSAMRGLFDLPDLLAMEDAIANGNWEPADDQPKPLALFPAPRVDLSLQRLRHYSGTDAGYFQKFVLFTNYQFYIDEFVRLGREIMARAPDLAAPSDQDGYVAFIEPGNIVERRTGMAAQPGDARGAPPPRVPQMPAYHLIRADGCGITMINIGVGPANAKNITDHIAVLRPHAWLMLGHCAGLRNTQQLGDYVLAHAYVRDDHALDEDLPLWVPVPPLGEVQIALQEAVGDVLQVAPGNLKQVMRTGTVASTDNRNWELLPHEKRLSQSRAIALDMESATIAANGFRFRVPYGTLLCVSDKPLHGEIKLPGMADQFYRQRVSQHMQVGIRAIELMRQRGAEKLHSRKLRSFAEVAFQ